MKKRIAAILMACVTAAWAEPRVDDTSPLRVATEHVQAYWSFDDGSADDASRCGNDGTKQNGVSAANGVVAGAMKFNGSDGWIDIAGYNGVSGSQDRSISHWFKSANQPSGNEYIVVYGTVGSGEYWLQRIDASGYYEVDVNGAASSVETDFSDATWHHAVVVLNGDSLNDVSIYIDGVIQSPNIGADQSINTGTANNVEIGRYWSGAAYFDGLLDELLILDIALTPAQVRQLYLSGLARHGGTP